MDQITLSSIFTVLIFAIFIAIVMWAYSKKSKASFEEAANLIFDDEIKPSASAKQKSGDNNQ
ncbi:cbb3-type cytochrome c oxidase subunit 3 [Alteromonadaceae bacterium BrNp21-10]|nr:cbb3-type cytochrome c oxidase subunit 3 [Alteromonadaceae bacterium BrNp21-10]